MRTPRVPAAELFLCLILFATAGCSGASDADGAPDAQSADVHDGDAGLGSDAALGADASPEDPLTRGDVGGGTEDVATDTDATADSDIAAHSNQTCIDVRHLEEAICTEACVLHGDVHIEDESDLAKVAKSGCDVIDGSLFVQDAQVTSLDGLDRLRVITGAVKIEDNARLVSIGGLQHLERFGGMLYVRNNDMLPALDGFYSLHPRPGMIGTDIRIEDNLALRDLEGLNSVESAQFLWIEHNPELEDLHGLRSLEAAGWLSLAGNDSLVDLRGLESLETVYGACHGSNGGGFGIWDNERLASLDGLESLTSSAMGLSLRGNPSLTDISALESLTDIGNCAYAPGFQVHNNESLPNLDGFNIAEIQKVSIVDNEALTDIDALDTLTHAFRLEIDNNDRLTDVDGLRNLRSVGYPTGGRSSSTVRGGLYITGNQRLVDLDGLHLLGSVEDHDGFVTIANNPSLTDVTGLSALTEAGSLQLSDNDALVSLAGLRNLRRLNRGLTLEGNAILDDATALLGLEFLRGLRIADNPHLPTCTANAIGAAVEPGGEVEITGNDSTSCP